MHALKLNLLENGVDFIRSALEMFFDRFAAVDLRLHKYAVLHMFAGVTLILKERVRVENAALIVADGHRTIGFDEALKRLRQNARVFLDPAHVIALRAAQRMRNTIEHYECDFARSQTETMLAELAAFSSHFLQDHLSVALETRVSEGTAAQLRALLSDQTIVGNAARARRGQVFAVLAPPPNQERK